VSSADDVTASCREPSRQSPTHLKYARTVPEAPEGIEWSLAGGSGQTLLLDGGRAAGSGGCNRFTGSYELEGERLSFKPLASTRMACDQTVVQAEDEYFLALGRTASLAHADGALVLCDESGAELLRFTPPRAQPPQESAMELIHTCYRITDPDRSVAFYEALGFEERRRLPIRDEAINIFMGLPGDGDRLELTYNFGVEAYELGTGYGHIAVMVDDIHATLARLSDQGIEPEKPPYTVREGGSLLCFVTDPDGYRIELIERA
jgi:lactoylglutathione lyase